MTNETKLILAVFILFIASILFGGVVESCYYNNRISAAINSVSCSGYYNYSADSQRKLAECYKSKVAAVIEANQ